MLFILDERDAQCNRNEMVGQMGNRKWSEGDIYNRRRKIWFVNMILSNIQLNA
jgi:hypothetical protein